MASRTKIKLFLVLGILLLGLGILGWASLSGKITFKAEETGKTGPLKGKLTDWEEKPLSNGTIFVAGKGAVINPDGTFEFTQLPVGYYSYYIYGPADKDGNHQQYRSYWPENMVPIDEGENELNLDYLSPIKDNE